MVKKKVSKKSEPSVKSSLPSNSGLISYILGIVAIVEAFVSPFAGVVLSIIGLVFSRGENSELSQRGKRLNTVALIIGIVLLILTIILAFSSSLFPGA